MFSRHGPGFCFLRQALQLQQDLKKEEAQYFLISTALDVSKYVRATTLVILSTLRWHILYSLITLHELELSRASMQRENNYMMKYQDYCHLIVLFLQDSYYPPLAFLQIPTKGIIICYVI